MNKKTIIFVMVALLLGLTWGFAGLIIDVLGMNHLGEAAAAPLLPIGWHVETVDSEGRVGRSPDLALDAGGYPHISYTEGYPNDDLLYAYQDDVSWHIEVVGTGDNAGDQTSIALDANGVPHISQVSWITLPNHHVRPVLMYATKVGDSWVMETVDGDRIVGGTTSIVIDANGYPHISYVDATPVNDLRYAYKDASGWHLETIDAESFVDMSTTSLALDSSGFPHISYGNRYSGMEGQWQEVRYAYLDAAGWHLEVVEQGESVRMESSLTMDQADQPHISYSRSGPENDVRHAIRDSSGWVLETVDSESWQFDQTSIAVSLDGVVNIAYNRGGDLALAYLEDGLWQEMVIDDEVYLESQISLDLDSEGNPAIAYYYGFPEEELRYASYRPPGLSVDMDIQPGEFPNLIEPLLDDRKNIVHVSVLTGADFDAVSLDPMSARFGPNGALAIQGKGIAKDVDLDGDMDITFRFRSFESGIACEDTSAYLFAETYAGETVFGIDSIQTENCEEPPYPYPYPSPYPSPTEPPPTEPPPTEPPPYPYPAQ